MLNITTYAKSISTTILCAHLNRDHLELYLCIVQENGWDFSLHARSQAWSKAAASGVRWLDEFTKRSFQRHILDFIVADNQVCSCLLSFYVHYAHVELQVSEHHRMSWIQTTAPPSTNWYHRHHDPTSHQATQACYSSLGCALSSAMS